MPQPRSVQIPELGPHYLAPRGTPGPSTGRRWAWAGMGAHPARDRPRIAMAILRVMCEYGPAGGPGLALLCATSPPAGLLPRSGCVL